MPFKLGTLVSTNGIDTSMQANKLFDTFVADCLMRYIKKDWGDTNPQDARSNNAALKSTNPGRILAVYKLPAYLLRPVGDNLNILNRDGGRETAIWFITEWDRSVTTILFPGEY